MTKAELRNALVRGLGSALVELETCQDPHQHHDVVLAACLRSTVFDAQVEGDRGWYLHKAATAVGGGSVEEAVIATLLGPRRVGSADHVQLCAIVHQFAVAGSQGAHAALGQHYQVLLDTMPQDPPPPDVYDDTWDRLSCVCHHLVELGGWDACEQILHEVSTAHSPYVLQRRSWFYDDVVDEFGKDRVEAVVGTTVEASQAPASGPDTPRRPTSPVTLDDLLAGRAERYQAMQFVQSATEQDVNRLLEAAVREPDRRPRSLWGLRKSPYPLDDDLLFALARNDDEYLRDIAFTVMGNHPSPTRRGLALALLDTGEQTINAIDLLARTMVASDEQRLCDAVKSLPVGDEVDGDWHSVCWAANASVERLDDNPTTDLLQYVYRQGYCSVCRSGTVRLMHDTGVLPDTIMNECLRDSYEETRQLARTLAPSAPGLDGSPGS